MEYQHGGDIYGNSVDLDFSVNLNPFGMPQSVKQALREAIDRCCLYPDSECRDLKFALGEKHGVGIDRILCGNGAADLIFQVVFAKKPGKAVLMAPTFSEYEQALTAVGCETVHVFLKEEENFELPLERLLVALDSSTDLLFLCNPNNPTGNLVKQGDMVKILECCKEHDILLVADECFMDFTDKEKETSLISLTSQYKNLAVLKAFTKMYGMAGVRLGYLVCKDRELLDHMESIRQPWSVSALAQAAGLAALKETEAPILVRSLLAEERPFLKQGLESLGFKVWESQVNYLLFSDLERGRDRELYQKCLEKGLLIRWCGNYHGLNGRFYRVCVRNRQSNEILLKILRDVVEERRSSWLNQ